MKLLENDEIYLDYYSTYFPEEFLEEGLRPMLLGLVFEAGTAPILLTESSQHPLSPVLLFRPFFIFSIDSFEVINVDKFAINKISEKIIWFDIYSDEYSTGSSRINI